MDITLFPKEDTPAITPLTAGHEKCKSGYSYTYYDCEFVLVHYCISGCGLVTKNHESYKVSSGQIFIIRPGETVNYTADTLDPWDYVWFSFECSFPEIIENLPVVADIHSDIFIAIKEALAEKECNSLFVAAKIYELLYELARSELPSKIDYPKNVKLYIQLKYADEISVEQIAHSLNINRRYMSRIFKERYGKTVMEYLVDYRLKKASERLLSGASVSDVAKHCGYRDVFNFSKMFKRKYGVSPSRFALENITKKEL